MPPDHRLSQLAARLGLQPPLRHDPDWAAAGDFLEHLVDHCLATRPSLIVECGSGLSTLILAACCARNGSGHVYSLEHGPEFATATRAEIARRGLEPFATVIDAPLRNHRLAGEDYPWYTLDALSAESIALLVIDGPPGFLRRHARYPALPLLFERLAGGASVFLDDAARADEKAILALWQAEFPGLSHEIIAAERGCSILRLAGG